MKGKYTFQKRERIVSQKVVDELFTSGQGHSLVAFPLRAVYFVRERPCETDAPAQLLLSVPKRRFRHAVDRNRVKRQLREAFRHHRAALAQAVAPGQQVEIAFVWIADQHFATAQIDRRIAGLLHRIGASLQPAPAQTPVP